MFSTSRSLTASVLVVVLTAALVPFSAPAFAAEVGIAAVGSAELRAVSFIDGSLGFAAGATGEIYKTTNGGSTWTKVRNADTYSFTGIDFWSTTNGVAVDASGKVASTTNGGDTWTNVDFSPYADMDQTLILAHGKVACIPGSAVALAMAGDPTPGDDELVGGVLFRTNGSLSFWGNPQNNIAGSRQQTPHYFDDGMIDGWEGESLLLDVDFSGTSVGMASGIDYYTLTTESPDKYPIYTTANSGVTWTPQVIGDGTADYRLNGVALGSTTAGVTVGTLVADGTARAFYTTNTGVSWTAGTLPVGFTASLNGADMSSATQGWAVADGGAILRTIDGGATWTSCTVPAGTPALYDIEFTDGTTNGWAVGASGAALRTTDGINWEALPAAGGDTTPPVMGDVTSSTHPVEATWYSNNDPALAWSATDASGIAGCSYVLDTSPSTTPDTTLEPAGTSTSYTDRADGLWYFHIRAKDSAPAGNWSSVTHRAVRIDTTAPSGTVSINGGAAATNSSNVTLTLSGADGVGSGVTQMRISNDGTFDTEVWETYATSKAWTLSAGDGTKTVYAEFRDGVSLVSGTASDSISLDGTAPSGTVSINGGAATTNTRNVTLTLSASDGSGSGVTQMRISNDGVFDTEVWETYATSKAWTLSAGDGVKTVTVEFRDAGGMVSGPASDSISMDATAPSGTVSINGGAAATNVANVTLTISASDGAGSGVTEMRISNDGTFDTEVWETYATSKSWALVAGDGVKTVTVAFRDALATVSAPASDSITLDTTPPSGTVSINGTAATTNTRNVTLTLSATDAGSGMTGGGQMRVSEDSGFSGVAWETYATSKAFTLSTGDGMKTVYAQFRDNAGNTSSSYLDMIELDTSVPPTVAYLPLEGPDRYHTAVAVSKSTFPAGSNAVIIATGLNFPDALASAGLAGVVDAPVLLVHGTEATTRRDELSLAEADRVLSGKSPKRVYIIGGPPAVSSGIESALKSRYGAANVVRLGGSDRYGTANAVAVRMKAEMASRAIPWSGDAFIVPGLDFRDALIVGPEAYAANRPILLFDPRGLGGLTSYCTSLGVKRAAVSGAVSGTGSVPTALAISGVTLSRIANAGTPSARSVQVANWADGALPGFGWTYVGLATAGQYPDGLSAASRQGTDAGPLLLTPSTALDASVRSALVAHDAEIAGVRYFGGPPAISLSVRSEVDAVLH